MSDITNIDSANLDIFASDEDLDTDILATLRKRLYSNARSTAEYNFISDILDSYNNCLYNVQAVDALARRTGIIISQTLDTLTLFPVYLDLLIDLIQYDIDSMPRIGEILIMNDMEWKNFLNDNIPALNTYIPYDNRVWYMIEYYESNGYIVY